MNIFHAIILAVVEGFTEFLPISSTGHMILTAKLLSIPETEFVKTFEIVIQLGAILAAIILYSKTLLANRQLLYKVITAFIPTGLIGFTLYKLIKDVLLVSPWITVISLFLGGIALILIEYKIRDEKGTKITLKSVSYRDALIIGTVQSLSIIPGVSRAASTILGGLLLGMNRRSAVEFSFMLAIPTMIVASGYDLLKSAHNFSSNDFLTLGVGVVVAFVVAYTAIRWLLKFIQTNTFIPFGIYRIALAILFALFVLR